MEAFKLLAWFCGIIAGLGFLGVLLGWFLAWLLDLDKEEQQRLAAEKRHEDSEQKRRLESIEQWVSGPAGWPTAIHRDEEAYLARRRRASNG